MGPDEDEEEEMEAMYAEFEEEVGNEEADKLE